MFRKILTLLSFAAFVSSSALAQSVASGQCQGVRISGAGEVPIQISAKQFRTATSAKSVVDFAVSLGSNNGMAALCLQGGGTVALTLQDSQRYAFLDIRFEYPYGFEPAASPFKLAVVHPGSVVFHMQSSPVSDGLTFKYTVTVKDLQTGAVLIIDPTIVNVPT